MFWTVVTCVVCVVLAAIVQILLLKRHERRMKPLDAAISSNPVHFALDLAHRLVIHKRYISAVMNPPDTHKFLEPMLPDIGVMLWSYDNGDKNWGPLTLAFCAALHAELHKRYGLPRDVFDRRVLPGIFPAWEQLSLLSPEKLGEIRKLLLPQEQTAQQS